MGNISKVYENGDIIAQYAYDKLNRLVREDNKRFGKTWLYSYDNNGNLLVKKETTFTLKTDIDENTFTINRYAYVGDQLKVYNDETFIYDEIGNPTTYRGKNASWERGRLLTSFDGHNFTYDGQGRRLTKDGISFSYDGNGRVVKQSNGLEFFYDNTGVAGVKYNNESYVYRKNVQGDIVAILDTTGKIVVKYTYDAWGNHAVEVFDTACSTLATLNPFRYRGYYYDTETELYFLKTRYYDPEIGRFMTIDGIEYLDPETINGLNLYAYCGNNPVMNVDPNGKFFHTFLLVSIGIGAAIGGIIAGITAYHSCSRGWDLFGSIAKGLFIGAIVGGIIGGLTAALIYAAPAIGSFFGSAFQIGAYLTAAGELVAVTVTGAQIAAAGLAALVGLGVMFASTNRSGDNRKKNEQYREAMRRLGYNKEDWQWRYGHDHLPNESIGFKDLLNFLKELFSKFK